MAADLRTASLDLDANVALAVDVLVDDLALHEAQGVEHLHDRCVPLLLERPRDLRREPVMGMDQVVGPSLRRGVLEQLRREFVEVLVDLHLRPVPHRAGLDVDDPSVRTELLDPWVVLLAPASEDVDLDASRAEVPRELPYVDVHPPGVATAQFRQGAGMDGEHGDPSRHGLAAPNDAGSRDTDRARPMEDRPSLRERTLRRTCG
jgi:hypothetical protein